jgi:hypothetical protein
MTTVDPARETVVVSGENVFPGGAGDDDVRGLLSLALSDPSKARDRFPDYRLTRLVLTRFDMDDVEASVFIDLTEATAPESALGGTPFNDHLRTSINRYALGRHHQAIRPTGYDYYVDAVDAAAMEKWRADYRAMSPAQQMFAATIIWLYRGGKDNRWLRRVPSTWHAVDAIDEMRGRDALADWGCLISLYPGW